MSLNGPHPGSSQPASPPKLTPRSPWATVQLLLAQGLGSGRLPQAPGTWGSLVGLVWWTALVAIGHPVAYAVGTLALLVLAVPLCARAEQLLGVHDPPSVVFDEIAAVPLCYVGWMACDVVLLGGLPAWSSLWTGTSLGLTLAGFVLFRLLDALKPGPIGWSQRFPAGWGIVTDDVVAALLTGLVIGGIRWVWS